MFELHGRLGPGLLKQGTQQIRGGGWISRIAIDPGQEQCLVQGQRLAAGGARLEGLQALALELVGRAGPAQGAEP